MLILCLSTLSRWNALFYAYRITKICPFHYLRNHLTLVFYLMRNLYLDDACIMFIVFAAKCP